MNKQLITITCAAQKRLLEIINESGKKSMLFYIKSGGCNGFEYRFKPINKITNKNNLYIKNNLKVEVCDKSLLYILGTKIDWKKDIMGESFKFDNPLSQNACGCGSSFSPF